MNKKVHKKFIEKIKKKYPERRMFDILERSCWTSFYNDDNLFVVCLYFSYGKWIRLTFKPNSNVEITYPIDPNSPPFLKQLLDLALKKELDKMINS